MDGLDAGRDPGRGEPAAVGRIEQLDVLDPGHERDRRRPSASRASSAARTAASPIAWIWRRDPAGRRPLDALAQLVRLGDPDAAPALGRERAVGLGLDVGQQRRRPRPERAVGEALLPADPGATVRVRAEDRAAAQAAGERRVERVVAQRGVARGAAAGPVSDRRA